MTAEGSIAYHVKEVVNVLKRLSDSKRRANALKAVDILLTYDDDPNDIKEARLKIVKDILASEYVPKAQSPSKHTI